MTIGPTPLTSKYLIPELQDDCASMMARWGIRNARWKLFRHDWPGIRAVWENSPWSLITARKIIDLFIHCHAQQQEVECHELISYLFNIMHAEPESELEQNLRTVFLMVRLLMMASIPWRSRIPHPDPSYRAFGLFLSKEACKKWPLPARGYFGPCSVDTIPDQRQRTRVNFSAYDSREDILAQVEEFLFSLLNKEGVPW